MHQKWFAWQKKFMLFVSLTSFGLTMKRRGKILFSQMINSLSNYQLMQKPVILPVLSYFFPPDTYFLCQYHYFLKCVSLFTAFPVISFDVLHCVMPQEKKETS